MFIPVSMVSRKAVSCIEFRPVLQLLNKLKGPVLIVALVIVVFKPGINLVLPQYLVPLHLCAVIGHDEITQKPQGLFVNLLQLADNLFPGQI